MPLSSNDALLEQELLLVGIGTNVDQVAWSSKNVPPLPEPRSNHAAVALQSNQKYMIIGGNHGNKRLKSVLVCNLESKEWDQLSSWPKLNHARSHHAAVCTQNKVYVFGGLDGGTLDSIECLDVSLQHPKWQTLKSKLTSKRYGCTAAVVEERYVYIFGGTGNTSVDILDTATDEILVGPPMSVARWGGAVEAVGTKVFVFGGDSGSCEENVNTIECLDTDLKRWKPCQAKLSTPKWHMRVQKWGESIIIVGGEDNNGDKLAAMEVYDTNRDVCIPLPNLSVARSSLATVVLGNKVYAIGGHDGTKEVSSVECFELPRADPKARHFAVVQARIQLESQYHDLDNGSSCSFVEYENLLGNQEEQIYKLEMELYKLSWYPFGKADQKQHVQNSLEKLKLKAALQNLQRVQEQITAEIKKSAETDSSDKQLLEAEVGGAN